ncbi:transcription initiation factor IIB [Halogeometricum pallidum]|nr:transcription initiation factor IIB family protein [Halogeometricum pallidum]
MAVSNIYETSFDEACGKQCTAAECPECDGTVRTDGGETRCLECGLILSEYRLDHAYREFVDSEAIQSPARTGAPLTAARHDRGLSSEIGRGTDGNGNGLSSRKRRQLSRLRREHRRARWRTSQERNLGYGCGEIARMTGALELGYELRERAAQLFRTAQYEGLLQGRSIDWIAAGAVYGTCRCASIIRPVEAIAEVARCSVQEVKLGYNVLNLELGLETEVQTPIEYIPQVASACRLSQRVRSRATELAHLSVEASIANGRKPSAVAAACVYLASQELDTGLRQTDVAAAVDSTPVTVRRRYYELQDAAKGQ